MKIFHPKRQQTKVDQIKTDLRSTFADLIRQFKKKSTYRSLHKAVLCLVELCRLLSDISSVITVLSYLVGVCKPNRSDLWVSNCTLQKDLGIKPTKPKRYPLFGCWKQKGQGTAELTWNTPVKNRESLNVNYIKKEKRLTDIPRCVV